MLRWYLIIGVFLLLGGCGFIPWQLSVALNGADLVSATATNKTLGAHAVSAATGEDCQWYRLLDGEKACMTKEEELEYLLSRNCNVHAFNVMNIPLVKTAREELLPECEEALTPVDEEEESYCDPMGVRNCPEELDNFELD